MCDLHSSKRIMFSYQWNIQSLVDRIHQHLEENYQLNIWMDNKGGMKDSLTAGMAEGVQNSSVLVAFLTPEYQQSMNCKKELTYAMQLKKHIIPILIGSDEDSKWKPSDWLGLAVSDLLYLNFNDINDENFHSKCEDLVGKIEQYLNKDSSSMNNSSEELSDQDD